MATKTQIGAVIGIEGATKYMQTMKNLARDTKVFKADMEALTSSFDKNGKSIDQLNKQKKILQKLIDNENKKLVEQNRLMDQVNDSILDGSISTEKWVTAHKEIQTEIDKTTTNLNKYEQQLKELNEDNALTLAADAWKNATSKTGEVLKDIGETFTKYVTLPIVGGFTASVKAYSDWETAMTGVKKTTGMAGEELDKLGHGIQDMALETSFSSNELAKIAQIAGQLGIRGADNILHFTKIVSDMGLATDLTAEDAATSLARIFNITEGGVNEGTIEKLEKIGDVIVHLGNNTATTEPEITAMANRMASAAHTAGLTTEEIFALSAALSSVGITAEAGGSTIGQVLSKLDKDVAEWVKDGEGDLIRIAEISGMSAKQFAAAWEKEPVRAFEAFVTGLGNLEDGSDNINIILDELSMAGIRESNMLKALAEAQDNGTDSSHIFTESLRLMEEAYGGVNEKGEKWSALQEEADAANKTSAVKFMQLKESLIQLGDAIGEQIVPVLIPFVEKLTDIIRSLRDMDDETKQNILKFLGLVAVIGPVISSIGNLMIFVAKLKASIAVLKGAGGITGLINALSGTNGKGGLMSAFTTVSTFIKDKFIPLLGTNAGGLGFALASVALMFAGAKDAAEKMNKKMYESAEACEYVAQRYHWTEEKVNEFGYTWDENGHLVELGTQRMQTAVEDTTDAILYDVDFLKSMVQDKAKQTVDDVATAIEEETPTVQEAGYKMVITGVDDPITEEMAAAQSHGAELTANFASGIESNQGLVARAASWIASTVRSFLHFSEPDIGPMSNFHTWMPDMMSEMASGIRDNMYLVENALGSLTGTMANQLNNNYASAGMNNGMMVTINVSGNNMNSMEVANLVERKLLNEVKRNRYAY